MKLEREVIEPIPIPIGRAPGIRPGQREFTKGEAKVRIIAAVAARYQDEWAYERAGWYVLCNGRVVLSADKTDLTGWGHQGLPHFHSKYNGFVGVVIFRSRNPLALPWTTTKRGLNLESAVYQSARVEMALLARPIISFLNDMYKQELPEEPAERQIVETVRQTDLRRIAATKPGPFVVKKSDKLPKTTVRIRYDAERSDVDKIKNVIRQPKWSANKIGLHTFQHFIDTECPE